MEDSTIRAKFETLQDQIRSWARKYSASALADLDQNPRESKTTILRLLGPMCATSDWDILLERLAVSQNRIPALLMQALLARHIMSEMFKNPFFAFVGSSDPWPSAAQLGHMYAVMKTVDQAEAHMWRSHTLQMFTDSSHPSLDLRVQKLSHFSRTMAARFLNCGGRHILRSIKDEDEERRRFKDLETVYRMAGDLALSLWTIRTDMRCLTLKHLPEFQSSNGLMCTHRLHQLDEYDQRLDGQNVILCVQPAIVAYGNENGEHYDQSKVWAKSVMLMEEGREDDEEL
ncbi:hypothetical protein BO99DRAFT_339293 [Aspergillus violaceofuscus CBS 115571]|uniref:Uncharacterized protein n=1 Tax=Aspergillus violaceofuscus (strain CBS 115571) TaxID=1450538 RepID=A0A2V5GZ17_ASPV1|nr:hypothetical protein BO99DRAFT_339293 [Aspergillus violaceofuscus CBS 115571]